MRLTLKEIEARVAPLGHRSNYDRDFVFDLLLAYGRSPGNVTRLRSSSSTSLNVATDPSTEVAQKNTVYFKEVADSSEEALLGIIEELSTAPAVVRYNTRFVIVTDHKTLLAKDTKTGDTLSTPIVDIADHFTFFLPWAGMEKSQYTAEAHADVKAAERMALLFDELIKLNPEANRTALGRHSLNIFFTRLLFCFFAEDTRIFDEGQFTEAVGNLTQADGSDLHDFLGDLFTALDTERREAKPKHLAAFPYVNGHLFTIKSDQTVPKFSKKARDYLLESGKLNWSEINPDIFGSMFQAIVTPGQRSDLGQHYTSVPNILKTIEPLFLNELKEELDLSFENEKKLTELLRRIAQIKIFDPACGSGNFLIIAYKELRKLEHAILERLHELTGDQYGGLLGSQINIENFYGIEIDDFAVEVAILSMWIAKHQMNIEFRQKFGTDIPLIPLREMGHFARGNAARVNWEDVCPNDGSAEIYLIGNPPYVGTRDQTAEQKSDYYAVFKNRKFSRNLDYIALWFIKGAEYVAGSGAKLAFVTTNSVAVGEHVGLMFPMIWNMGVEIGFAYTGFKWANNAKRNATVTVAVIGLRSNTDESKYIYTDDLRMKVDNINGYLAHGDNMFVGRRSKPLQRELPPMLFGNMALDHGALLLSPYERDQLLQEAPHAAKFVRQIYGSREYIQGLDRYCIWIQESDVAEALSIPAIADRVERTRQFRLASKDAGTQKKAEKPWSFREQRQSTVASIIVPKTSSELREYLPMGYLSASDVISDLAFAVVDPPTWVFGLLTSRIHNVWIQAVAGRKDNRIRYANMIVYNNFPVPPLSDAMKDRLTEKALRVLDVREYHSELTLADLYDPDKMPDNLRQAHTQLDDLVDLIYRKRDFASDEERLSLLFEMYAAMTEAEGKR